MIALYITLGVVGYFLVGTSVVALGICLDDEEHRRKWADYDSDTQFCAALVIVFWPVFLVIAGVFGVGSGMAHGAIYLGLKCRDYWHSKPPTSSS